MTTPKEFQLDAIAHHANLLTGPLKASAEASVPGFGKTFVAAFVARQMGHQLVVVCPRVVIPHWEAAAAACGATVRCISNYEQHKLGNTGLGEWLRKPAKHRREDGSVKKVVGGTWRWTFPKPTLLVFDEAHYCKSRTSQNAKLMIAAKRQGIPTLIMSATLAVDPLDLFAAGYLLDLHDGEHGWKPFLFQHGVLPVGFELKFCPRSDPGALVRLNSALFPGRGHRKDYHEIPGFPEAQDDVREVAVQPADLMNLRQRWERITELEQLKSEALTAVTERLRARQLAEMLKVPAIVELATDLMLSGLSVPIFLNFHDSIDAVQKQLGCGVVDGRVAEGTRRAAISAFQEDATRCLILQADAGGVGISLHDTAGKYPRHSILSPGDNARTLIQCLGRNRRVGQKSPAFRTILTLAQSVEQKVHRNLTRKINQLDTINDGDLDILS